jgi:DNA-binding XRE family transcriptional regulator
MSSQPQRRNHLYTLRRIRGFRQKQLAHLLGYRSTTMVSRFESGNHVPPLKVALMLEIILGARLSEIYVDLYRDLSAHVLDRSTHLPAGLTRQIRGRLLGKD